MATTEYYILMLEDGEIEWEVYDNAWSLEGAKGKKAECEGEFPGVWVKIAQVVVDG